MNTGDVTWEKKGNNDQFKDVVRVVLTSDPPVNNGQLGSGGLMMPPNHSGPSSIS